MVETNIIPRREVQEQDGQAKCPGEEENEKKRKRDEDDKEEIKEFIKRELLMEEEIHSIHQWTGQFRSFK